jgi:hypothetical protein
MVLMRVCDVKREGLIGRCNIEWVGSVSVYRV